MGQLHVRILANPMAGAGKVRRQLPEVRAAFARLGASFDVVETRSQGDGQRLAREARSDGVDLIAIMGGDGTINEVAHAYVDEEGNAIAGPEIGIIPTGTGGDFRKTIGVHDSIDRAVERIVSGTARDVDLGSLEVTDFDGRPRRRAFINITSFGIGGVTDRLVNQAPKWLGGKASFYLGTLRAIAQYRNAGVQIRVDDKDFFEGSVLNVAIANGRFFGGGMMIAPHADLSDALFDIVTLGDLSVHESIGLTGKIYKGTHLEHPKVSTGRGAKIIAEPARKGDEVLIDMDGETPGKLPLTASVLPSALRIRS